MKKSMKKLTALVLALVLCVGVIMVSASARSSLYLDAYRAWLTAKSGGKINVTVDVEANGIMDQVGASRIEIFESKDGGSTWKSVEVYYKSLNPEMYDTDTSIYYDTPISYSGTAGYQYSAIVTVFAGDSTGSDSRDYTTTAVTAKK